MKNIALLIGILGLTAFWTKALHAQFGDADIAEIKHPVVVELFTSQSCSSCPPADENLAELSKNPNVIALGFHVTYWDHLHWKDTLSQDFATERQRNYAAYKGNGRVYTPQMIVNGGTEFVGSRERDLNRALEKADEIAAIALEMNGDKIKVAIPDFAVNTSSTKMFWLFGIKNEHIQEIPRGENRGRTVTYKNAVMEQIEYSRTGSLREFEIDNPYWVDEDAIVLIAQDNRFGNIIAAGKLAL